MQDWKLIEEYFSRGSHGRRKNFAPYKIVKKYAKNLDNNLKTGYHWQRLHKHKKLPPNFPSTPSLVYKKEWIGWRDFFETEIIYATYDEAKQLANKNNIKNNREWKEFLKNKNFRKKYPYHPMRIYKEWTNWHDFLENKIIFLLYEDAKQYAKENKIKTSMEWQNLSRQKQLPKGIPRNPDEKYKNKGWISWKNFLETDFVPFEICREFAQNTGIKTQSEWYYAFSQKLFPEGIPSTPNQYYGRPRPLK